MSEQEIAELGTAFASFLNVFRACFRNRPAKWLLAWSGMMERFLFSGGSIMARSRGRSAARERYWRGILFDWEASGLSVSAYCRRHGVAQPSLYYWRRELASRDRVVDAPGNSLVRRAEPAFVPVRVVGSEPIEVVMRSGQVVRVAAGFDPTHLRAVVSALEAKPC
jgi:hypothetical protein